jgi:hypothetical protein
MNKKLISGLAIAAATTIALGVVATAPATAAAKKSVTLAFQGPLTGPDALSVRINILVQSGQLRFTTQRTQL